MFVYPAKRPIDAEFWNCYGISRASNRNTDQTSSLKTKIKFSADCLRKKWSPCVLEVKYGIQAFLLSIGIPQQTAEFESGIRSSQDVSPSNEVFTQEA